MPAGARRIFHFPEGFEWGAATAAFQIEGSADRGGRRPSIWDGFLPTRGYRGDGGEIAADHYRRWAHDLDLLVQLGVQSYRFSISWSRVVSDDGTPNPVGLAFYDRLLDGLLERGVAPAVTMYHMDIPARFPRGWVDREAALRFGDYANLLLEKYGDRVPRWMTINEPYYEAWLGYGEGVVPPGGVDRDDAVAALHHLLLAHGQGVDAVRDHAPSAEVGFATGYAPVIAATSHPDDVEAARIANVHINGAVLDTMLLGGYPAEYRDHDATRSVLDRVVQEGDEASIGAPVDFVGLNYYFNRYVAASARAATEELRLAFDAHPGGARFQHVEALGVAEVRPRADDYTMGGWIVEPSGLERALREVTERYSRPVILITENGIPLADYADPHGEIHDVERIEFHREHLGAVASAIEAGADVRGYYAWSLLDNLEWTSGFAARFGLVFVDFPTQKRIPKDSFYWYSAVVTANAIHRSAARE